MNDIWIITIGTNESDQHSPIPCSNLETAMTTVEHISETQLFRVGPVEWESYNGGHGWFARFDAKPLASVCHVVMVVDRHTLDQYTPKMEAKS
jgi:hypothetical protein